MTINVKRIIRNEMLNYRFEKLMENDKDDLPSWHDTDQERTEGGAGSGPKSKHEPAWMALADKPKSPTDIKASYAKLHKADDEKIGAFYKKLKGAVKGENTMGSQLNKLREYIRQEVAGALKEFGTVNPEFTDPDEEPQSSSRPDLGNQGSNEFGYGIRPMKSLKKSVKKSVKTEAKDETDVQNAKRKPRSWNASLESWEWRIHSKGSYWRVGNEWGARAMSGEVDHFTTQMKAMRFADYTHKPKDARDLYVRGKFESKKVVKKEVSPPGWSGTTKAMKKHKDIDNPFALAWSLKNKGAKPHYKPEK